MLALVDAGVLVGSLSSLGVRLLVHLAFPWNLAPSRQLITSCACCPLVYLAVVYRQISAYFPISLVKTADLDPGVPYLFGFHPHGILSMVRGRGMRPLQLSVVWWLATSLCVFARTTRPVRGRPWH